MNGLVAALRDEIRRDGPMSVARFMAAALYDPQFGYYTTRDPLGTAGDFTTAPEISQMFGEMLGAWLAVTWQQMGSPAPVRLVELGPGRGTLMNDVLRATRAVPGFHHAVDLHLVEISAPLRAAQTATLLNSDIIGTWHEDFATVPPGPLLVVANEFFDALPIHQYERTLDGWRERLVAIDAQTDTGFCITLSDVPPLREPHAALHDAPVGTIWEESPAALAAAHAVGERVTNNGGAGLIIDYGYADQRGGDSLQALRAHRRHDPLADPGHADITAHVNFGALRQGAEAVGATVYGPVDQGRFLLGLGLEARAERLRATALARNRPDQAAAVATAFKRLIAPTEMGSLFKVLALTGPNQPAPPGFTETSGAETS